MKDLIKIFLLEDDINFGTILKSYLELNGFSVVWVDDGKNALIEFSKTTFDFCIIDVMLPNIDGFSIAREIKKRDANIPFVFLTAKTLKTDVIEGFNIGADDYITKPFDSEVLLLKINVILKRQMDSIRINDNMTIVNIGKYTFNYELRTLISPKQEFKLSPKESELLKMLVLYKNNILPRDEALRSIWGDDNYFTTRSMDVYLTKLRKYLQDDPEIEILNVHGSGFRLISSKEGD